MTERCCQDATYEVLVLVLYGLHSREMYSSPTLHLFMYLLNEKDAWHEPIRALTSHHILHGLRLTLRYTKSRIDDIAYVVKLCLPPSQSMRFAVEQSTFI